MRRYISIPAVLFLWLVVHLDWHLARSHHHRFSMEWHAHWIVGLIAFFALALFCAWKRPDRFVSAALLNATVGIFLGHIGEAWLETLANHEPMNSVLTPERWRAFFQFLVAGLGGLLLGIVVIFSSRRERENA